MKKLEVYECSYSGKRFDSKKECLQYEKVEHFSYINREIRNSQKDKAQSSFLKSIKNIDDLYNIDKIFIDWEKRYNNCDFEIESCHLEVGFLSNKTNDPYNYNTALEDLKSLGYDYGFFIYFEGEILQYPFVVHWLPMHHGVYHTFKFIYEYFQSGNRHPSGNLLFRPDGLFIFETSQARFKEKPTDTWNVNLKKGDPIPKFSVVLFLPFEFIPNIGAKNLLLDGEAYKMVGNKV